MCQLPEIPSHLNPIDSIAVEDTVKGKKKRDHNKPSFHQEITIEPSSIPGSPALSASVTGQFFENQSLLSNKETQPGVGREAGSTGR